MRILHVTDAYLPRLGGIEMHVHDLARAQTAAGDQVDILTMTSGKGAIDSPASVGVIRPKDGASLLSKARFILRHRSYGVDQGYDVVHAHISTISLLSFFALGTAGVPRLVTLHSMWQRYASAYRTFDRLLHWSTWPVKYSAVSQVAAEGMRATARGELDISVISNGIDLDLWTPGLRTSEPGHLRILAVMRLAARKRPLTLLRILKSVRSQVPAEIALTATILGEGRSRAQMERYLERHDMADWVHLPGHLPRTEVRQMMAQADVFVAPATLESFGIAALEAHAAGLPVVGRSGNGLSEFIHNGEGGVLVDNDREMASVLAQMATERTHETVQRSSSLEAFDWPAVVERHRDLYEVAGAVVRRPQMTRVS
jgi:glycosyltransferase involved in cell wall biosynthesis